MELITVKQLPVIEEKFKEAGKEVDAKVKSAKGMIVTDANYKDIKKIRAALNKESKEFAESFKEIKARVLAPWDAVEAAYNENIKDKYGFADAELKAKITDVEGTLKDEKQKEIVKYFNEYAESKGIGFAAFADTCISVGMADSKKSLKARCAEFIDKVADDVHMIADQEHASEIMAEYKENFNAAKSMNIITERHAAIEAEAERLKESAEKEAAADAHEEEVKKYVDAPTMRKIDAAKEAQASTEMPTEKFIAFKVYGQKSDFVKVVEFLHNNNLKFEQINLGGKHE